MGGLAREVWRAQVFRAHQLAPLLERRILEAEVYEEDRHREKMIGRPEGEPHGKD